jgi:hypothetical protein
MATRRVTSLVLAMIAGALLVSSGLAQALVRGEVDPTVAPGDVVAEARHGFAYYPVEVGRGRIDDSGAFTLTFRETLTLPVEVTMPVASLFDGLRCDDVAISDPEARLVVVRDLRVIPTGASCEFCETLATVYAATRPRGSLAATGDLEVLWVHADRDVSLVGACTYGWGQEGYALALLAGWNTVVIETVEVLASDGFCDCRLVSLTVAPFPTEGVTWHTVAER